MGFDDTFNHTVRNPTHRRRVVLFADVVRHDCPWLLTRVLTLLAHHLVRRIDPSAADIAEASDEYAQMPEVYDSVMDAWAAEEQARGRQFHERFARCGWWASSLSRRVSHAFSL